MDYNIEDTPVMEMSPELWLEKHHEPTTIELLEKILGHTHPKKDQAHPKLVPSLGTGNLIRDLPVGQN